MVALTWVIFAISILIMVVSIIMSPESSGFSGAIVGSSDLELFKYSKERGSKKALKIIMFALGFGLMLFAIIARAS